MRHIALKSLVVGALVGGGVLAGSATAARADDWVALAVDRAGHWGWQFHGSRHVARERALGFCGSSGCSVEFTERARCIAYVESRAGGYWYGTAYSSSRDGAASIALGGCGAGAPSGTCRVVKAHCQGED
jgi:hypothetical protein